jgi:lipopolysaccharide transport system ATP-binding protein
MEPVIWVENISKMYQIGLAQRQQDTLRDLLVETTRGLLNRKHRKTEEFWALKDISFEVQRGEVVGIIGRNGAGKSTLLKILSRITEPTSGRAVINGRVGSLLEVGTGFHPELTGRENIYLNGAILGMRRVEIARKFDEIVAFAEVEQFLDTPVKRYSSGMYVRLAFGVAAHLEPEILLVDEVLAVGDAAFQKKCLGKMGEVAQAGRTVLFVSHNMNMIQRLCNNSLLLDRGLMIDIGDTQSVVLRYLKNSDLLTQPGQKTDLINISRIGSGMARFQDFVIKSEDNNIDYQLYPDCETKIELAIYAETSVDVNSAAVIFYDRYGTKLVNADIVSKGEVIKLRKGNNQVIFNINQLHLTPGNYILGLYMADVFGQIYDFIQDAAKVEVIDNSGGSLGMRADGAVTCEFTVKQYE